MHERIRYYPVFLPAIVIPEINGDVLGPDDYIIANPNCSTIQMLMALAPLHKAYGIKRIVVSTYQSVSGSGAKGVNQLKAERAGGTGDFYPHPIDLNTLPHIDVSWTTDIPRRR